MKVKPFTGKKLNKKQAKTINDMLLSAKTPDRTELKKEADEFIATFKARRAIRNNDKAK